MKPNTPAAISSNLIHPDNRRIELGGGLIPKISCSRSDLVPCVLAGTALIGVFFCGKYGLKYLFTRKMMSNTPTSSEGTLVTPKVETLDKCLNTGGAPKNVLIPDFLFEGGLTIIGGRTGVGKSILVDQLAVELARGYGDFVGMEHVAPQHVILIDGEMEDDDYKRRFPKNLAGAENITRVSDCEFKTIKELTDFVKKFVFGQSTNTVVVIDNLAALFPNPTAAQMHEFYGNLKKIQRDAKVVISYIIADHVIKVPLGQALDETHLAGSSNTTRFATNIAIVDWSARGKGYRYLKYLKQRKEPLRMRCSNWR